MQEMFLKYVQDNVHHTFGDMVIPESVSGKFLYNSCKIGFDAIKEHDRNISTRAYIGAKTKMQSRVKQMEKRIDREILEKENLLVDIETPIELKMFPQQYFKEVLVQARNYGISYKNQNKQVFEDFNFTLHQGERVFRMEKMDVANQVF